MFYAFIGGMYCAFIGCMKTKSQKLRIREMSARVYALHSVCTQLSFSFSPDILTLRAHTFTLYFECLLAMRA